MVATTETYTGPSGVTYSWEYDTFIDWSPKWAVRCTTPDGRMHYESIPTLALDTPEQRAAHTQRFDRFLVINDWDDWMSNELERPEYERLCQAAGITPLADTECVPYWLAGSQARQVAFGAHYQGFPAIEELAATALHHRRGSMLHMRDWGPAAALGGSRQVFGIGRVPTDVDTTAEVLAELAVVQRTPAPFDTRPTLVCTRCGEPGHAGAYPFSTLPDSGLCDDCL